MDTASSQSQTEAAEIVYPKRAIEDYQRFKRYLEDGESHAIFIYEQDANVGELLVRGIRDLKTKTQSRLQEFELERSRIRRAAAQQAVLKGERHD